MSVEQMAPSRKQVLILVRIGPGEVPAGVDFANPAWPTREEAPAYVVLRILFFQCACAFLDAADTATVVGQIKVALRAPDAHLEWTIQPMLDHLRSRLSETNYQFLKALAEALNDPKAMPRLEEYPLWRNATAATSD